MASIHFPLGPPLGLFAPATAIMSLVLTMNVLISYPFSEHIDTCPSHIFHFCYIHSVLFLQCSNIESIASLIVVLYRILPSMSWGFAWLEWQKIQSDI